MIVATVASLPQAVAAGGSLHSGGDNAFPLTLSEASSNARPDTALPVMALGTQVKSCSPLLTGCVTGTGMKLRSAAEGMMIVHGQSPLHKC